MLYRKLLSITAAVLFAGVFSLATEPRALAYVDPGSGLLILQNVGAVLTGVVFFFRRRIKAIFSRKPSAQDREDGEENKTPPSR